jgi:hypothetical protein
MIYNEGFEFRFNSESSEYERYFVFSKYGPNPNGTKFTSSYVSYCHETLVGWYNIGEKWGCFYGKKNVANPDEVTNGDAENKQKITEDSILFMEKDEKKDKNNSFLSMSKYSRFSETGNLEELVLDANFKDHSKLVERINSANLSWKAKNYKEFEGYTRGELKKMSSTIKISSNRIKMKKIKKKNFNGLTKINTNGSSSICDDLNNKNNKKLEDFKKDNFDAWEKFMTTSGSQVNFNSYK